MLDTFLTTKLACMWWDWMEHITELGRKQAKKPLSWKPLFIYHHSSLGCLTGMRHNAVLNSWSCQVSARGQEGRFKVMTAAILIRDLGGNMVTVK